MSETPNEDVWKGADDNPDTWVGAQLDGPSPMLLTVQKGRGAKSNSKGRFEKEERVIVDDGWNGLEDLPPFKTDIQIEAAKTIITRNASPDLSFDRSINPYRGCEHGCIYCFARPTHAYMGLSAGLDFESKIFTKPNAATLLEKELAAPSYVPRTIALGTNTDPYQPIERQYGLMRELLSVFNDTNHPVGIVTKSASILRDLDILKELANKQLVRVAISVTTLDRSLARNMEPRASTPQKRLEAIEQLSAAGIPVTVMVAPIIPALTDSELEAILETAISKGAEDAAYVLLRLPLEVSPLFKEWLLAHYPNRYRRVMNILRTMRGGKDYDAQWGKRMRGSGPYADQIARRFSLAAKRLGLKRRRPPLRTDLFKRPVLKGEQLSLFG